MTMRENLFRPIHKGLRFMIYETGLRLGTTDFSNVVDSNEVMDRLRHDLSSASSSCMLCLLRVHADHEERDLFSAVRPFVPGVVDGLIAQHGEILRRIERVSQMCDELSGLTDSQRRVDLGDQLNAEVDSLFTFYLGHLTDEETQVVPVMWQRFTDEQLRALRAQFYNRIPIERFEEWMRWTIPALNLNELFVFLSGMKAEPTPNRFADAMRVAKATLDPSRWQAVESHVGRDFVSRPPVS